MLTKNIKFKNFKIKKNSKQIKKDLKNILLNRNAVLDSLSTNYKSSYNKKTILKFKKFSNIRIIGMGGSILGTESIFYFLKNRIKKNLFFLIILGWKRVISKVKKKYLI